MHKVERNCFIALLFEPEAHQPWLNIDKCIAIKQNNNNIA